VHTALVGLFMVETLPPAERSKEPPRFQSPLGMLQGC
jgi:hypothetical protein